MKKILSILILTLAIATGCSSSKKTAEASTNRKGAGLEFEYSAMTRGSFRKIKATQAGISFTNGRDAKPQLTEISTADWNGMVDYYEKNLAKKVSGLGEIEVPSKKHQFDGAPLATFTVTVGDQQYNTPAFDHGNPPAQVKPLVDEMMRLAGMETNK